MIFCLLILIYAAITAALGIGAFAETQEKESKTLGLSRLTTVAKNAFASSVTESFEKYSWGKTEEEPQAGEREAKLGLAYLLGEKDSLDKQTKAILRTVGLTHLVVASGTHLGILVTFFKKGFGKISRFAGMFFAVLFIIVFGEMIGWTASITRAAIVAGVALIGWYSGKHVAAWRVILLAMAVTLLIDPSFIIDIGWLLSFASFIGTMMLVPAMKRFFYGSARAKINWLSELVLASVAATLMCAPMLLYFFGQISLISVVANILIMPTIAAAMGLTFLVGMTGWLPAGLWWLKTGVVAIAKLLLDYHLVVMEFFAGQTMFLLQTTQGNWLVLLLYIPILAPFILGGIKHVANEKRRIRMFREHPEKYLRLSS